MSSSAVAFPAMVEVHRDNDAKRMRLRDIVAEKSLTRGLDFELSSGNKSQFYFDMKPSMFDPEAANLIAELVLAKIAQHDFDFIGGLEMGAVPIVANVCLKSYLVKHRKPILGFFVRRQPKTHGTRRTVEGVVDVKGFAGKNAVIVDDVTTRGESALKAVRAAREAGAVVDRVITIVDRLEGAEMNMRREGLTLAPILTTRDFPALADR